jgi:hypothetical protein
MTRRLNILLAFVAIGPPVGLVLLSLAAGYVKIFGYKQLGDALSFKDFGLSNLVIIYIMGLMPAFLTGLATAALPRLMLWVEMVAAALISLAVGISPLGCFLAAQAVPPGGNRLSETLAAIVAVLSIPAYLAALVYLRRREVLSPNLEAARP